MGYTEPEEDELALIQRAATGDHEAFRRLVLAYEGKLQAYLTQMLGDSESARDIAQETFIATFYSLPRWHAPVPSSSSASSSEETEHPRRQLLAPWLYRIATNLALSLLRKRQVRQRVHAAAPLVDEDDNASDIQAQQMYPVQEPFEDRYIARILLQEALSQLSAIDAACVVLHFVNGERYQEIAGRLGLSNEAVRKRVMRALPALRKAYLTLDSEVRP